MVACSLIGRNNNSPRGHSPNRERDSYRYNLVITNIFIVCCNKSFIIMLLIIAVMSVA